MDIPMITCYWYPCYWYLLTTISLSLAHDRPVLGLGRGELPPQIQQQRLCPTIEPRSATSTYQRLVGKQTGNTMNIIVYIYIYKYISWSCLFPLDTKMIDIDLLIHNFPRKIFGFSWFFHLQVRWSRACLSSIQQQSQPGAENVDKKHQMFTEKYCRITNHSQ